MQSSSSLFPTRLVPIVPNAAANTNSNRKLTQVQIFRVTSACELWISEKEPVAFINMIHSLLEREEFYLLDDATSADHNNNNNNISSTKKSPSNELFAAFDTKSQKWYRARSIRQSQSFGESAIVSCFLVDTGETIATPKSQCKRILSLKLVDYPPLAKRCTLHGLKPTPNQ